MTYQTLSELLILFLLFISCLRVFFMTEVKTDPLSVVPSISLVLSFLNVFAWGISLTEMLLIVLSLFIFICNLKALICFSANLVVDHYSIFFTIVSILCMIICFTGILFVYYFRPVKTNPKKYSVTIQTTNLYGNFSDGLSQRDNSLEGLKLQKSATIKKYIHHKAPVFSSDTKETSIPEKYIIFVSGKASDINLYEPMFIKLCHDGYTVIASNFYPADMRFFNNIYDLPFLRKYYARKLKINNNQGYSILCQTNQSKYLKEYEFLLNFINPSEQDKVYLVCDQEADTAISVLQTKYPALIDGNYDISNTSSYVTKGFGPVEQTEPFLAFLLDVKKDRSLYMSSHIATILEDNINLTEQINNRTN